MAITKIKSRILNTPQEPSSRHTTLILTTTTTTIRLPPSSHTTTTTTTMSYSHHTSATLATRGAAKIYLYQAAHHSNPGRKDQGVIHQNIK